MPAAVEAVVTTEDLTEQDVDEILDRVDGLMLLGGDDLSPAAYGQEPHPKTYGMNDDRDEAELLLRASPVARAPDARDLSRPPDPERRARRNARPAHHRPPTAQRRARHPGVAGDHPLHDVSIDPDTRLADALVAPRPVCVSTTTRRSPNPVRASP